MSLGMKVTSNGDFCQVFLVLGRDCHSQAEACLRPSFMGTRAAMPSCLSAWLLSLGAVPILLICLLFSCEGLCCKKEKKSWVVGLVGLRRSRVGGNAHPCFNDSASGDLKDAFSLSFLFFLFLKENKS